MPLNQTGPLNDFAQNLGLVGIPRCRPFMSLGRQNIADLFFTQGDGYTVWLAHRGVWVSS